MLSNMTHMMLIESTDFSECWEKILKCIVMYGDNVEFGDIDEIKRMREVHGTVRLYGTHAISQVLNLDVHPSWQLKGQALQDHVNDYLVSEEELIEQVDPVNGFEYTYQNFMRRYGIGKDYGCGMYEQHIDQLSLVKDALLEEQKHPTLSSNRHFIFVNHYSMMNKTSPACLQMIFVRRITGNKYSVRYVFRSQDAAQAWMSNTCALTTCMNEFVFKPSNTVIEEIIYDSLSLHVYANDKDLVESVTGIDWDTRKPKNKTSRTTIHSIHQSALNKTLDKISERCEEMKKYV